MLTRLRFVGCVAGLLTSLAFAADTPYFRITVVDEQTGRGVPLVELKTTNSMRFYTDSNGVVAFNEPGLMNQRVFFFVKSHGYEFPKDGFGMAGRAVETRPGGSVELKIKRLNIAERLYRITGQGIYRDCVLLGLPVPIKEPVINGLVMGSDSIQHIVYGGLNYWFWGDTGKPSYALGNFHMTSATSALPGQGGLDPDVGIDLKYFVGKDGFARQMAPRPEPGPIWCDAYVTLPDATGRERMYCGYARVTPSMETVERGIMRFDDERQTLEKIVEFDKNAPVAPHGHPFKHRDGGMDYLYFPQPFPLARVRAELKPFLDVNQYEGYTCLVEGSRADAPKLDRDENGRLRYGWKRNTPPLKHEDEQKLIKAGELKAEEALMLLRDVDTGKTVVPHSGSVYWNPWRKRWITIRCEIYGTSMLGEIWYAEADTPVGPWVYARKIVTHDKYTFYNPKHHPVFDKDGGRIIYFEGTYTYTFSGATEREATPQYDYNQIMYKLDLSDPRLVLPVAVYAMGDGPGAALRTSQQLPAAGSYPVAFFAPDRAGPGLVGVFEEKGPAGVRLRVRPAGEGAATGDVPLFYGLAADAKEPPTTTVPLFEFVHADGQRAYGVDEAQAPKGYTRSKDPICRVWRSPTALRWKVEPPTGK